MDKFDRIFQLHAILVPPNGDSARRPDGEAGVLEVDAPSDDQCAEGLSQRAGRVRRGGGWVQVCQGGGGRRASYELPGLWFTPRELQALAVLQRLLKDAGGGLLEEHLAPLVRRLDELTKHQRLNLGEAASRLRFPSIGARPVGKEFSTVVSATLQRRKLWIEYHARSTDARSETDRLAAADYALSRDLVPGRVG